MAVRSPRPASPANVSGLAPAATPRRVISTRPRGDEGRFAVVPVSEAVADASSKSDDVLEAAAQLHAHHVGVGVHPEH